MTQTTINRRRPAVATRARKKTGRSQRIGPSHSSAPDGATSSRTGPTSTRTMDHRGRAADGDGDADAYGPPLRSCWSPR